MELGTPLMLLGALALVVPVALHLWGRQRARVVRFAAMDFLLGTQQKTARRLRVRERLLLALRVIACLALALALAKPLASCAGGGTQVVRGPQAVAIVIDDSLASRALVDGETLLNRAQTRARRLLDQLGAEADVVIVRTSVGAPAPGEPSRDHLRLGRELSRLRPSLRPADTLDALRRAQTILASSPHAARRVYLIAAPTMAAFPGGSGQALPWAAGAGPELHVIDPSDGAALDNLAVVRADTTPAPELGGRAVRVSAEIVNLGAHAVKDRGVTVKLGGRALTRGLVSLLPGARTSKEFSVPVPGDARGVELTVTLDPDSLPADDERATRADLGDRVRVLLVDGDPRTARHDDELFYIGTALAPGARTSGAIEVSTVTADDLASVKLTDVDVIFLCNVRALDPLRVGALAAWVQHGGGLFLAMGDNVDVDAWNATMRPLLPNLLQSIRTLAPPNATDKERDDDAERIAAQLDLSHPILAVFDAEALRSLRAARFYRVALTGSGMAGSERRVLARFGSGAPALVEARLGKGRLLFYAATVDRDWTDLPIVPAYLPLVQQSARYLARAPMAEHGDETLVGQSVELAIDPEDTRVEITAPDGRRQVFDEEHLRGRAALTVTDTSAPGVYHVAARRGEGQLRSRPGADFVVNVDGKAGDLRHAQPLSDATEIRDANHKKSPTHDVELWHALAAGLLGLLVLEGVLGRR
jgi:hypothetical protein